MPKFLTTISTIALLAFSGAVYAQDTAATDTAQPEGELSLGEEVVEEGGIGSPYVRENEGDWSLECLRVEEGQEEPCQMLQALNDADGNQVANVRMFRLPDGGQAVAGALVAVPLETLLTAQLTITVDGAKPKRYPFSVCDRLGCYARIGLTSGDVAAYKKGAKATVTLVPFVAPDQKVELPMSLTGFTAAYDKTTTVTAPQ